MSFINRNIRRSTALLFAVVLSFATLSFAGEDGSRKVTSKVTPSYPEVARRMNISGNVRLEVEVAPNGSVKNVKALGGHPLLIDAAINAVKQWKYEAGGESTIQVEIKFNGLQ